MVGCEDDQRVIGETALVKGRQETADLSVEVGDLTVVGGEHFANLLVGEAAVGEVDARVALGVGGAGRDGGNGPGELGDPVGVLLLELATTAGGHGNVGGIVHRGIGLGRVPGGVRVAEGDPGEERLVYRAEVVTGLGGGPGVDVVFLWQRRGDAAVTRVLGKLPRSPDVLGVAPVQQVLPVVVAPRAETDELALPLGQARVPEAEAPVARLFRVELAKEGRIVARAGQDLGEGCGVLAQADHVGRVSGALAQVDVVGHAMVDGVLAGEDTRPGGGADRMGREGGVEGDPSRGQPVEVGRPHERVARIAQDGGVLLVGGNEQDVRSRHGVKPFPCPAPRVARG